ncbi:MAG: hypothetical protein ACE5HP_00215 [Gemmatimonadota bacterium]
MIGSPIPHPRGLAGLAALFLVTWTTACRGGDETRKRPTTETTSGLRIIEGDEGRRTRPRHWVTLKQWAGGAGQTLSDTFRVEAPQWRIAWESRNDAAPDEGVLSVFVYSPTGRLQWVAVNRLGAGTDTAYYDGGGEEYYLLIRAEDTRWTLAAQVPADSTTEPGE